MHAAVGVVGSAVADGLELTSVHVFGAVCVSRSASATNASTAVGEALVGVHDGHRLVPLEEPLRVRRGSR